jgi:hypothetical protein
MPQAPAVNFHPLELLDELETRYNRSLRRAPDARACFARWSLQDEAAPASPPGPLASAPRWLVVLTTYGRPGGAARVLDALERALAAAHLAEHAALLVLHDRCDSDYEAVRVRARDVCAHSLWLDARERFGKPGFWRVHQTALFVARAWSPERTLYLQDDVVFEPDLFEQSDALWRATAADPARRVLYLFSSRDDEPEGRWARFERRDLPGLGCRQTNWFDLQAFIVDRAFFELLRYRMVPIHPNRWKRQPEVSSGVGRQLTLRSFGRASVYQAWPPLVRHGDAPSTMNAAARAVRPLDNRDD